jgi:hypothetical protein
MRFNFLWLGMHTSYCTQPNAHADLYPSGVAVGLSALSAQRANLMSAFSDERRKFFGDWRWKPGKVRKVA